MSDTSLAKTIRWHYLLTLLVIVPAGLLSRRISWLPESTGDMLWAMMVFCLLRIVLPSKRKLCLLLALAISFADEFSQLIQWEWLCQIRSTMIGHLILGQGFMWTDLVAYTLGIALMIPISLWLEPQNNRKE